MWIYTTGGFYSLIQNDTNPTRITIRSRVDGDLQRLWPAAEIEATPQNDYLYRTTLSRAQTLAAIAEQVQAIDYGNYKSAVRDYRRLEFLGLIWAISADMGEALESERRTPFNGH
jgi:hypothetical protein